MKFRSILIIVSIVALVLLGVIFVYDLIEEEVEHQTKICASHGETLIPPTRYSDPNVVRCANDEGIVVSRKRY